MDWYSRNVASGAERSLRELDDPLHRRGPAVATPAEPRDAVSRSTRAQVGRQRGDGGLGDRAVPCTTWVASLLVLALLLSACGGDGQRARSSTLRGATTVVSITFDDGLASQARVLPLLDAHDMVATFYVNSGTIGGGGRMSWAQVRELSAVGNEVGGHTVGHVDLSRLTAARARYEVCADREALVARGFRVTSFAFPYGRSGPRDEAIVRGCGYRSGRGVGGVRSGAGCRACQYAETLPPPNPYHLNTPSAGASPPALSWLESVVKQAEEHQGGWVVLVFHNVCDLCGTYAVSPDTLDHFLAWLEPRWTSGTRVATVSQTLAQKGGRR